MQGETLRLKSPKGSSAWPLFKSLDERQGIHTLLRFYSMSEQPVLNEADLAQFTGTEQWYQHPLGILYTDGVRHVAQQGGAYWLIDAIASWQLEPDVRDDSMLQEIQFWKLVVNEDRSAVLTCERDTDDVAVTQSIPLTDFPLRSIRLFLEDGVLMLPSER